MNKLQYLIGFHCVNIILQKSEQIKCLKELLIVDLKIMDRIVNESICSLNV